MDYAVAYIHRLFWRIHFAYSGCVCVVTIMFCDKSVEIISDDFASHDYFHLPIVERCPILHVTMSLGSRLALLSFCCVCKLQLIKQLIVFTYHFLSSQPEQIFDSVMELSVLACK